MTSTLQRWASWTFPIARAWPIRIFSALAAESINVDMIVQTTKEQQTTDMLFSVSRDDLPRAKEIVDAVAQELGARGVIVNDNVAKVSIVGAGMVSNPGVAARMFEALAKDDINIQVISTSEIKVSCLVKAEDALKAVRVVHEAFGLDQPGQPTKAAM